MASCPDCLRDNNVRVILLPAENLDRKQNHEDGLDRKLSDYFQITHSILGRKQEIADSLAEAEYDRRSRQEAKQAGLCSLPVRLFYF